MLKRRQVYKIIHTHKAVCDCACARIGCACAVNNARISPAARPCCEPVRRQEGYGSPCSLCRGSLGCLYLQGKSTCHALAKNWHGPVLLANTPIHQMCTINKISSVCCCNNHLYTSQTRPSKTNVMMNYITLPREPQKPEGTKGNQQVPRGTTQVPRGTTETSKYQGEPQKPKGTNKYQGEPHKPKVTNKYQG